MTGLTADLIDCPISPAVLYLPNLGNDNQMCSCKQKLKVCHHAVISACTPALLDCDK